MGVVSDAIDALENWCCNLFKDGIKSQFDSISELLTDTFDTTTGNTGLIQSFLTKHPAQFTGSAGSAPTGYGIWSTIETLCNNVVVPIGGFILTIILLNDLIQTVIRGNNFKDFDDSIFIKWIIKALCGVILVSNVFYIASGLFSFGTNVCANGLTSLFGSGSYLSTTLALKKSALNSLGLGELITVWFISLIVHLGVMILMVAIVITLASRIIEVFMYLSISPIPMATMMDGGEWSGIGKNWIKQLLALSFQGFFIIVALAIFKTLFSNMITALNSGADGVIMQMAMLLGYTAALIFTILRTGAISKSVFNAH
ncbi:MAG: CD0415/CD1112 family protein [Ruminococcus callidus]|nr:CD0415/CD1112 family protein [Ruminococcus callidus]